MTDDSDDDGDDLELSAGNKDTFVLEVYLLFIVSQSPVCNAVEPEMCHDRVDICLYL